MKAAAFWSQTVTEIVDTVQKWSKLVDADGNTVGNAGDFDEFIIDSADNGVLRFPPDSQWEAASDAVLRLGGPALMPDARKYTLGSLRKFLESRPFAFLAEWFKEPLAKK